MNEEDISSYNIDTIVTFVGFTEKLVMEFLKPYINIKDHGLKRIVLFSSAATKMDSDVLVTTNLLLQKVIKSINKEIPDINIDSFLLGNIWNLKEYHAKFNEIKSKRASVNITAGPSVFSIAAIIWAIENNHFVEHSVESNNPLTGKTVVFRRIDVIPYFKSIFFTDRIDKRIIEFLKEGAKTSTAIRIYLKNQNDGNLSLRTIENRINRLNEFGILSVYRGRQNIIDLSDDIKNVI